MKRKSRVSDRALTARIVLILIYIFFHFLLAFYIKREETFWLLGSFASLFLIYFYLVFQVNPSDKLYWFGVFLSKAIWCAALPNLSDDYFRFIWDGTLTANGLNPFSHTPSFYIENNIQINGIDNMLYYQLNSPAYYTVYPPICQGIFFLSALPEKTGSWFVNILIIRFFIILIEGIGIFYLVKILRKLKKPSSWAFYYALNPLVIVELTGNLHVEGIMIGFLLISFYSLLKGNYYVSAILFSFAICIKLLPLWILPFFIKKLENRRRLRYVFLVLFFCLLLFIPFLDYETLLNLSEGLLLYVQKFEFNASIYYVVRSVGYWIVGYNAITTIGTALLIISFLILIRLIGTSSVTTWEDVFELSLLAWITYILFSTTVHPWYITPLVMFASLTGYISPLFWSFIVTWSYHAYTFN
ncbi:MAG: hypothetical protein NZ521_06050, partial [Flammeovirgaceae bacterium]|nr:hypothetical protein [Flammeovirgaceae bacterium]MDW8287793.1 hypothetical protein [Flammeovirgaceae bacterium]